MGNVSTHVNGEVTSDGTRGRLQWVGGTQDGSTLLDNILAFPDGGQDWTRQHVRQQGWEEWLLLQVLVVVSQQRLGWLAQLDTNQLEASVLESGDDRGNQSSLDSVGLNGNKGSLVVRHFVGRNFFFTYGRGELNNPHGHVNKGPGGSFETQQSGERIMARILGVWAHIKEFEKLFAKS